MPETPHPEPPPEAGRPPPEAEPTELDLDRSLVSGIVWTAAAKWTAQVFTWGSTILVARFLTSEDFGLVGMATLYLGMVALLSEFGFGAAVVALRSLTDRQIAQLNTTAVLFGFTAVALSLGMARPLGWFFDAPRLPLVVVVMSSAFLVSSIRVVPESLLRKELHFKSLAMIAGGAAAGSALLTLVLAALGFGYWALVIGNTVNPLLMAVLVLRIRRHSFSLPRPREISEALHFSAHLISSRLAWYAYSNADFLVVGRILGQASLGLYSIGWSTASIPVSRIAGMVSSVTPSLFSAVQDSTAQLRRYFLLVSEGMATATFPVAIGLALVAPDFVPFALGDKWAGAILPMQILALYASFRSLTPLLSQVLNVTGQSRQSMWYAAFAAVLLTPSFFYAARWGLEAVALVWLVVHPIASLPAYVRVFRTIEIRPMQYVRTLWPAVSSTTVMATGTLLAGSLLPTESHGLRLAVEVTVGAVLYVGTLATAHRDRVVLIKTSLLPMLRK